MLCRLPKKLRAPGNCCSLLQIPYRFQGRTWLTESTRHRPRGRHQALDPVHEGLISAGSCIQEHWRKAMEQAMGTPNFASASQ